MSPWGCAYRLGGDEFCVLIWGSDQRQGRTLQAAGNALSEVGEAFTVTNSHGSVVAPLETTDVAQALGLADARLYAAKDDRPTGPADQVNAVLRQVLAESEPELDDHVDSVASMALGVARRLELDAEDVRTSSGPQSFTTSARSPSPTRSSTSPPR